MFRTRKSRLTLFLTSGIALIAVLVAGSVFFAQAAFPPSGSLPSTQAAVEKTKATPVKKSTSSTAPSLAPRDAAGCQTNCTTPTAAPAVAPVVNVFAAATPKLDYPADFLMDMVNVKTYGAKGNGVADDTAAIQRALSEDRVDGRDYYGWPKALYFPAGTYLVSASLHWDGCCVTLMGQGSNYSIIRLKDGAAGFNNVQKPQGVIITPDGNMSFRQNIWNLGINTGSKNPGAIGLDYIANNTGSIDDVAIVSQDGQGHSGLNMTRAWPGPSLIKMLRISGFNYGIIVAQSEYGPTFEHIQLQKQRVAGISNTLNILAMRDLQSTNSVPAIRNEKANGAIILLDSTLQGGSSAVSAIENNGYLYGRNVKTTGYRSAVANGGKVVAGTALSEYISDKSYSLFQSAAGSLKLPILETPTFHDSNLANWVPFKPSRYGDVSTLQSVFNAGKSTVYFPFGAYLVGNNTVVVPPNVRRIVGFSSIINSSVAGGGITFKVTGNTTTPLIIEGFAYGVKVELASARPVTIRHGEYKVIDTKTSGDLFLEDTGGNLDLVHPHRVWSRQLNSEGSDRTQVMNNGATLWILGIKTEGIASIIDTRGGGKTELLGTLIYPAASFPVNKQNTPAFISVDSSVSYIYGGSAYLSNSFYKVLISDTRKGVTKQLLATTASQRIITYTGG